MTIPTREGAYRRMTRDDISESKTQRIIACFLKNKTWGAGAIAEHLARTTGDEYLPHTVGNTLRKHGYSLKGRDGPSVLGKLADALGLTSNDLKRAAALKEENRL